MERRRDSLMPEVGDMAPDFELPSNLEKGKNVRLSDFRGKKNVVMAFYPLAWTPV
jgi:peroxiredoxin